jgi:hypothetical protein
MFRYRHARSEIKFKERERERVLYIWDLRKELIKITHFLCTPWLKRLCHKIVWFFDTLWIDLVHGERP